MHGRWLGPHEHAAEPAGQESARRADSFWKEEKHISIALDLIGLSN
jgi:hypothetical protein